MEFSSNKQRWCVSKCDRKKLSNRSKVNRILFSQIRTNYRINFNNCTIMDQHLIKFTSREIKASIWEIFTSCSQVKIANFFSFFISLILINAFKICIHYDMLVLTRVFNCLYKVWRYYWRQQFLIGVIVNGETVTFREKICVSVKM